ncbi:porin [Pararhodobacter sp. CCB-MM2]|uniref:porin n=1 Tax=Pararhodobacter sp. CCB-MM2 TaxID=1786003 RepID=UPI00082BBD25|nr:porin [Pararhodobacter sp. CCB-MM2]
MKKILLASTALVLSAGLAHAQAVTITGEGRMGIQYDDSGFAGGTNWRQENRLTLNFNVSVEADHGLTFGAWSRARMQVAGLGTAGAGVFSGSRVWAEANGLRLTFGNQDGAMRGAGFAMGYAGGCGVGYEGGINCWDSAGLLGVSQGQNSTGSDNQPMARVDYTFGTTRVALSHSRTGATELGVRSTFGAFTVGLAYSNNDNAAAYTALTAPVAALAGFAPDQTVALSGRYDGGSWGVGALVARLSSTGPDYTNWAISGDVDLGGGNLYGYVGDLYGSSSYGLSYSYGLGGGASLVAGAEHWSAGAGNTVGSVGVVFTF